MKHSFMTVCDKATYAGAKSQRMNDTTMRIMEQLQLALCVSDVADLGHMPSLVSIVKMSTQLPDHSSHRNCSHRESSRLPLYIGLEMMQAAYPSYRGLLCNLGNMNVGVGGAINPSPFSRASPGLRKCSSTLGRNLSCLVSSLSTALSYGEGPKKDRKTGSARSPCHNPSATVMANICRECGAGTNRLHMRSTSLGHLPFLVRDKRGARDAFKCHSSPTAHLEESPEDVRGSERHGQDGQEDSEASVEHSHTEVSQGLASTLLAGAHLAGVEMREHHE